MSSKLKQQLSSSKFFRKAFYHNKFVIIDFGTENKISVHSNNKVIGKSIITVRKGNGNAVDIDRNGKFNNLLIDIAGNNNQVTIEDNVKFSGKLLIVGDNLAITIGQNTTAIDCYILARDKSVVIGKNCMISRGIEIRATDVHKIYDMYTNKRLNTSIQNISISDRVWIAANVTISKNVRIASDCVIAAGSFVNKSFNESNCIIAGRPAKVVKTHIGWER